jgi:hypothetical protein
MSIIENLREALAGSDPDDFLACDAALTADSKTPPPPCDLRCANPGCDLYQLRPEADEVAPTPGTQPDRCASCGSELKPAL